MKRAVVVLAVAFNVAVVAWLVYAFLRFNHVIENPQQHNPGWLCEPELDPHSCAPRP